MSRLIVGVVISWISSLAVAGEPAGDFRNLAYDDHVFTVEEMVLGRACFSLPSSGLGFSCNPAFLADEDKTQLRAAGIADRSLPDLADFRRELHGGDSSAIIRRMLKGDRTFGAHGQAAAWYQNREWAVAVTPARLGGLYAVRNVAFPNVTAHLQSQMEITGRMGLVFEHDPNLRVGANVRLMTTEFIRQDFAVVDVLADARLMRVREQHAVYVEPGVAYTMDGSWSPTVSAALTHLPIYSHGRRLAPQPALELGYMVVPDFWDKKFRSTLHFTSRPDVEDFMDRLRWASIFEFSHNLALSLSLSAPEMGIGLLGRIDSITLGVGYRRRHIEVAGQDLGNLHNFIAEAGLTF